MTGCSVTGCTSRSENGFILFQVPNGGRPKNRIRRKLWLERINRTDNELGSLNYRICVLHFNETDFFFDSRKQKHCLLPNAMPIKLENCMKIVNDVNQHDSTVAEKEEEIIKKTIINNKKNLFVETEINDESSVTQAIETTTRTNSKENKIKRNEIINDDHDVVNNIEIDPLSIIENAPIILISNNQNVNSTNEFTYENLLHSQLTTVQQHPNSYQQQENENNENNLLVLNTNSASDNGEQELTPCTNRNCKIIKLTKELKLKKSKSKIDDDDNDKHKNLIINPVFTSLLKLQKPNSLQSKTIFSVRGTEIFETKLTELLTNDNNVVNINDTIVDDVDDVKGENINSKNIKIIYKIMPNTHAHVINYIRDTDKMINSTSTSLIQSSSTLLPSLILQHQEQSSSLSLESSASSLLLPIKIDNEKKLNEEKCKIGNTTTTTTTTRTQTTMKTMENISSSSVHKYNDADNDNNDDHFDGYCDGTDVDDYSGGGGGDNNIDDKEKEDAVKLMNSTNLMIVVDEVGMYNKITEVEKNTLRKNKRMKKVTKNDSVGGVKGGGGRVKKKTIEERLHLMEMKNLWSVKQINKMNLEVKRLKRRVHYLNKMVASSKVENNNHHDDYNNDNDDDNIVIDGGDIGDDDDENNYDDESEDFIKSSQLKTQ